MTSRGKTTPDSTAGSYSPSTGPRSRVTPGWQRQTPALASVDLHQTGITIREFFSPAGRTEHDLSAPYQRASVWDVERQRNLIRSVLLGIPTGVIIRAVNEYDPGRPYYRIVDGKQRIEALTGYADGDFSVPADWWNDRDLADVTDDGQVYFSGLSPSGQIGFKNSTIAVADFNPSSETTYVGAGNGDTGADGGYVHRRRSPDEVLQAEALVYSLINTGGVAHTDAELQRATDLI